MYEFVSNQILDIEDEIELKTNTNRRKISISGEIVYMSSKSTARYVLQYQNEIFIKPKRNMESTKSFIMD